MLSKCAFVPQKHAVLNSVWHSKSTKSWTLLVDLKYHHFPDSFTTESTLDLLFYTSPYLGKVVTCLLPPTKKFRPLSSFYLCCVLHRCISIYLFQISQFRKETCGFITQRMMHLFNDKLGKSKNSVFKKLKFGIRPLKKISFQSSSVDHLDSMLGQGEQLVAQLLGWIHGCFCWCFCQYWWVSIIMLECITLLIYLKVYWTTVKSAAFPVIVETKTST